MAWGFQRRTGADPATCVPARIPLLAEVLGLISETRGARLSIHPKDSCVEQVLDIARANGALDWIGFNDSNTARLREVRRLNPRVPIFWDRLPIACVRRDLARAIEYRFEALVLHHATITQSRITRIHEAGLECGAWTVNSPRRMEKLINAGVDRLYTDDPARFIEIKAS